MAGELMMAESRARGGRVLPIDSEHCALHQCLDGRRPEEVRRLVLTASGGPFRNRPRDTFDAITREEALNHPTWSMGRKITIDSATLMNKGLEVIEAHWLFGVDGRPHRGADPSPVDRPLHGRVRGRHRPRPARRHRHADAHPVRALSPRAVAGRDPRAWTSRGACTSTSRLPDHGRFPCLGLAYRAIQAGGSLPAVLNAANEEAVAAFLDDRISFNSIPETIAEVMDAHPRATVAGPRRRARGRRLGPGPGPGSAAGPGLRRPRLVMTNRRLV